MKYMADGFSLVRHVPEKISRSDVVVVSFDEIDGGFNNHGFGTNFLIRHGVENIFVSHPVMSFYQRCDPNDLLNVLSPFLNGKRVITYGASLGGYAALYYAGWLNAVPLSISPRCSIDPIYGASSRFHEPFVHFQMDGPNFKQPSVAHVIYDPCEKKDKNYFDRRVSGIRNLDVMEIHGGTHWLSQALSNSGVLKSIIFSIIDGGKIPDVCVDIEKNPAYTARKSKYLLGQGDFNNSAYFLSKSLEFKGSPKGVNRYEIYNKLKERGVGVYFEKSLFLNWELKKGG